MLKALFKTMRPRQWTKNVFIFAALVFDKQLLNTDSFLRTLAGFGLEIRHRIRHVTVRTPVDLAERTAAWRGALYGISSNQALNAFRRPHNRCAHVAGLYFVGGATHPGGGVPMVTLSGKVAAELLLADQGARPKTG